MTIAVIGTGYVGLVGSAVFSAWGNTVWGVDKLKEKIDSINKGVMPIYEPGLSELVGKSVKAGTLKFTTDLAKAVKEAEVIFICVGTPSDQSGAADLSAVWAVAKEIAISINTYKVVVVKSTVPVGTNEEVERIIKENAPKGSNFDVVSCPEFLREGYSIEDSFHTDRTVIGSKSQKAIDKVKQIYAHLGAPIIECDLRSAEMIKYASNAFLATKISFINEIAQICERAGSDVVKVAEGMGYDKRIGRSFLNAGLGYGGSCFKDDTLVYVKNSPDLKNVALKDLVKKENEGKKVETLGFDLTGRKSQVSLVTSLTKRRYKGKMIKVNTRMGRRVEITADHPMIVYKEGEFSVKLAKDLKEGELLPFSSKLPSLEEPIHKSINLTEVISDDKYLVSKTIMVPIEGYNVFSDLFDNIKSFSKNHLKYIHDIKRYNKLPLRVYLDLPEQIKKKINLEKIRLYTVSTTSVPALIKLDKSFFRYIGYYLAEGHISSDYGRKNIERKRIGITFNEKEDEYISDIKNFYITCGINYFEKIDKNDHNVCLVVSSKIWAYLLESYFSLGTKSYTKRFPKVVFRLEDNLKSELLRGLFSGDGSLSRSFNKYPFIEYATVSKPLANDVVLLLQGFGVVSSINERMMNKSKVKAYIIRISGKSQLEKVKDILGEKRGAVLKDLLKNVKYIDSIGYKHLESFNLIPIKSLSSYSYEGPVYSLETSESTVVVNSGLITYNCFPKDVEALYRTSTDQAYDFRLLRGVMDVNDAQRLHFVQKVKRVLGGDLSNKVVACFGLAFKENTDDIRKSVALEVIKLLRGEGAQIKVFDPIAADNARKVLGTIGIEYTKTPSETVKKAEALCILTEWKEFKDFDYAKLGKLMKNKIIFDGRNILDPKKIKELGFSYYGVGRSSHGWGLLNGSNSSNDTNGSHNSSSAGKPTSHTAILKKKK